MREGDSEVPTTVEAGDGEGGCVVAEPLRRRRIDDGRGGFAGKGGLIGDGRGGFGDRGGLIGDGEGRFGRNEVDSAVGKPYFTNELQRYSPPSLMRPPSFLEEAASMWELGSVLNFIHVSALDHAPPPLS